MTTVIVSLVLLSLFALDILIAVVLLVTDEKLWRALDREAGGNPIAFAFGMLALPPFAALWHVRAAWRRIKVWWWFR